MTKLDRWKNQSRRGNYLLLMGVFIMVVIGFAAMAIDISYITSAELQAQAAADAASHAALVAYRQNDSVVEGNQAAAWILNQNEVAAGNATMQAGYPRYGSYNHETGTFCTGCSMFVNAVEVAVERDGTNAVNLLLAPLLGVPTADVDGHAITAQQKRAIHLVQDMSCSMMDGYSPGSGAIHVARNANLAFLNYMVNHPQDDDKLGLSVFGEFTTASAWAPLQEIAGNEDDLVEAINGICSTWAVWPSTCTAVVGGTGENMPQGIGTMTSPGTAMEQAISEILANTDITFFKGMIVMSDGLPNANGGATRANNAANTAWANDIHIWTITFHNGSFNPTFMEDLTRGIGFHQISPDPAELPEMYEEVAKSLPTALVD